MPRFNVRRHWLRPWARVNGRMRRVPQEVLRIRAQNVLRRYRMLLYLQRRYGRIMRDVGRQRRYLPAPAA